MSNDPVVKRKWERANKERRAVLKKIYYDNNKGKLSKWNKEWRQRNKIQALSYYSMLDIPVCAHPDCLVMDPDMLCIDHINGGGRAHRREIGGHASFYLWLIKNNFPEGYQVLCWNHNSKKGCVA
jgi:hypothetical protein